MYIIYINVYTYVHIETNHHNGEYIMFFCKCISFNTADKTLADADHGFVKVAAIVFGGSPQGGKVQCP